MNIHRTIWLLVAFLTSMYPISVHASWQIVADPDDVFKEGYIQVVGVSEKGQSRYRASRAAEVLAQRSLIDAIQRIRLHGKTTIKGKIEEPVIEGFLRGAIKCGQKYYSESRYAEACLKLSILGLGGLYDHILPLMKEKGLWPENHRLFRPPKPLPEPLSPDFDGIILDVRKYLFKPALANRIFTKNSAIIFDPSKIPENILVQRGCGGYTTTHNKAKALLQFWGAQNPIEIVCIGVRNYTDAFISSESAGQIFLHNKKTHMLSKARVVFLMK